MGIFARFINISLIILGIISLSCKSTKEKEEFTDSDQIKSLSSGILTFITLKEVNQNQSKEQAFESEFRAFLADSSELRDFEVSQQEILEKEDLKLANLTSHAEVYYSNGSAITNGCYNSTFVTTPNVYHPQTHLFIIKNNNYDQFFTEIGNVIFEGELCIKDRKIESISNQGIGNSKHYFKELFRYFDSIGLHQNKLNRTSGQLNLAAKNLDFNVGGKKYTAREEALTAKSKQIIISLPNGKRKHVFVPINEDLSTWAKKTSTKEYLEGLGESTFFSAATRKKGSSNSFIDENNPLGRTQEISPLGRSQEISSSYTDDFASLESNFTQRPGSDTPAGSSNFVAFGKIDGYDGEFVFRDIKDFKSLKKKDFDRFLKERDIIRVLAEANLNPTIGGKNGRTMFPQPLSIASDGLSSINQKLHPLSQAHLEFGGFNQSVLRSQFRSLAETIQFLHTPKKVNGLYYSISHRDLKTKNFLQQSSADPRAATTDFDLSEIISAPTLKELDDIARQKKAYDWVGSPITMDINIVINKKEGYSFKELQQSDIWSLGITMLEHTFGAKIYDDILGNPQSRNELWGIYDRDELPGLVEGYFRRSDAVILRENPGLTPDQLKGMKSFVKSNEYRLIKFNMLDLDPNSRSNIDNIVKVLSAKP